MHPNKLLLSGLLTLALGAPFPGRTAQAQTEGTRAGSGGTDRHGHDVATPVIRAETATTSIVVDGLLNEGDWLRATPATGFRQSEPVDGAPSTQRTEIRLLFDSDALYVGARMYDSLGAEGVRSRLVRRDQFTDSDWIELVFDTFHDHIGRTRFAVNPSGVRQDGGVAASFADPSWDPVWDAATRIDSLGWTAEFRIPFSQLRFPAGREQVWGLQIWRTVSRLNEFSMWSYWSTSEAGGPQRFGHVEGIEITGTPRRLELAPYVVAGSRLRSGGNPDDPFRDNTEMTSRFGTDLKYLLTSNLTLSATVNPDFGQVEVDPAVVNLSAFETFFPERRPFFIEGAGAFSFGGFNCYFCSNVSSMSLVFTRRIGRAPQGALPDAAEFADVPEATSILGAAKLTGRTAGGMTIGVLNAVTARETAPFRTEGDAHGTQVVEPLSNYFVGRVKQDFQNGDVTVGGIVTSVTRDIGGNSLLRDRLPTHAEALGVDWNVQWGGRSHSFFGNLVTTNASGDPAAILLLQRGSARYFQRPDRGNGGNGLFSDALDSGATHLRGYGGYARVAKNSGDWLWETHVNFRSPGFESNDLGFNTRSDYVWMGGNVVRNIPTPGGWYRTLWLSLGGQQQYNFDGDLTDRQVQANINGQFLNYWGFGSFILHRPQVLDDRATRGGPVVARSRNTFINAFLETDSRRAIRFNANVGRGRSGDGGFSNSVSLGTTFRPAPNISLQLSPSWSQSLSTSQFVRSVQDPTRTDFFGTRYVFSDTRQTTVSMNTRLNITFTPNTTLELFAQPFISSVDFQRFKEFARPRTLDRVVYGEDIGTITPQRNSNGDVTSYEVDPDGNGSAGSFSITNPDFVFRSLRGNAVLRWEYRPGATLFLVWTQNRSDSDPFTGNFSFRSPGGNIFGRNPENVFQIKASYWLNL